MCLREEDRHQAARRIWQPYLYCVDQTEVEVCEIRRGKTTRKKKKKNKQEEDTERKREFK
jgi:hypothetical protein